MKNNSASSMLTSAGAAVVVAASVVGAAVVSAAVVSAAVVAAVAACQSVPPVAAWP